MGTRWAGAGPGHLPLCKMTFWNTAFRQHLLFFVFVVVFFSIAFQLHWIKIKAEFSFVWTHAHSSRTAALTLLGGNQGSGKAGRDGDCSDEFFVLPLPPSFLHKKSEIIRNTLWCPYVCDVLGQLKIKKYHSSVRTVAPTSNL